MADLMEIIKRVESQTTYCFSFCIFFFVFFFCCLFCLVVCLQTEILTVNRLRQRSFSVAYRQAEWDEIGLV